MRQKIRNKFQELFSTEGSVYASPGRINLIGEHTDYNGGHVFPCALSIGTYALARKNVSLACSRCTRTNRTRWK